MTMRDAPDAVAGVAGRRHLHDEPAEHIGGEAIVLAELPRAAHRTAGTAAHAAHAVPAVKNRRAGRIDVSKVERAIDLRRLRYFVQIVADGSFSTAAQRVHVAQPALSHHVRELEATLGVSLLTRSAHGVVPTEAGQCLYEHGVTILGRVRDAAVQVSEFGLDTHRRVSLGLEASVAANLAAPLMEGMRAQTPDVQLTIEEGTSEELLRQVETKGLDMALLYDVAEKRLLTHQPLLTESLYLVGPCGAADSEVTFDEASRLPLILPRRPNRIRERLEEQAQASGVSLNVMIEIDGIASIKKLVRAGLGYSVLSASEFVEEQRMGLLDKRLIIRPQLEQTLYLCHLSGGQLSRSAKHVSRLALQLIETMVANASWPGLAEDRSVDAVVRRVAFG
jgi:LysR family nitrogen assimilation transcriptional regulator